MFSLERLHHPCHTYKQTQIDKRSSPIHCPPRYMYVLYCSYSYLSISKITNRTTFHIRNSPIISPAPHSARAYVSPKFRVLSPCTMECKHSQVSNIFLLYYTPNKNVLSWSCIQNFPNFMPRSESYTRVAILLSLHIILTYIYCIHLDRYTLVFQISSKVAILMKQFIQNCLLLSPLRPQIMFGKLHV